MPKTRTCRYTFVGLMIALSLSLLSCGKAIQSAATSESQPLAQVSNEFKFEINQDTLSTGSTLNITYTPKAPNIIYTYKFQTKGAKGIRWIDRDITLPVDLEIGVTTSGNKVIALQPLAPAIFILITSILTTGNIELASANFVITVN